MYLFESANHLYVLAELQSSFGLWYDVCLMSTFLLAFALVLELALQSGHTVVHGFL